MEDERAPAARRGATRADVARLAGVSTAVVSYTLNGGPRPVAAATAARVRDAVEKLGYRPNLAARDLSRGTSDVIGLVLPDLGNPFFAAFTSAVETAARRRGLDVLIMSAPDPASAAQALSSLDDRRVRGILHASSTPPGAHAGTTRVVQLNAAAPGDGVVGIVADLEGGTRAAVAHLIEETGRGAAFLGRDDDGRYRGWLHAHRDAGVLPGPVGSARFSRDGGAEGMAALIASAGTPRALFAASDMIAIGALHVLRERGLRVPDDVAVASFDGSPEARFASPPLTSVRQPIEAMAADAVAALLDADAMTPGPHVYPVELEVRASSAPAG